jgi:ABC-type multidrug transport system ATPase subunit
MLELHNVSHIYPNGTRALDDVSLTIPKGMFGLLGPNGAGKSTLMRTIATLQLPTSGRLVFDGIDVLAQPEAIRAQLGYLPQDFGVYPRVSAYDLLDHMAVLKGIAGRGERRDTVETLLNQVNLWDVRRKAVAGYSGACASVGIAQALIGNPRLVIVDEPTAGLDPEERNRFLNLLAEIGENVVVILSTHIVEDVTDLCPRMAILGQGRILLEGAPGALINGLRGQVWECAVDRGALDAMRESHRVISTRLRGGRTIVHVIAPDHPGEGFQPVHGGLEDVYFSALLAVRGGARRLRERRTMFGRIAAFEIRYQLRSPVFWVVFALFFLLAFGAMASSQISLGGVPDNAQQNGTLGLALTQGVMTIFALFVVTAFVANVIVRDDDSGFGPLVRATRVRKFDYLFGRFAGAYVVALVVFAAVPLGSFIGSLMPWLDPETIGPNRLDAYLRPFVLLAMPTLLLSAAFFLPWRH